MIAGRFAFDDDMRLVVAAIDKWGVSIFAECDNMLPTAMFLVAFSRIIGEEWMDRNVIFIAPRLVTEFGRLRRKVMFVVLIVRFRKKHDDYKWVLPLR